MRWWWARRRCRVTGHPHTWGTGGWVSGGCRPRVHMVKHGGCSGRGSNGKLVCDDGAAMVVCDDQHSICEAKSSSKDCQQQRMHPSLAVCIEGCELCVYDKAWGLFSCHLALGGVHHHHSTHHVKIWGVRAYGGRGGVLGAGTVVRVGVSWSGLVDWMYWGGGCAAATRLCTGCTTTTMACIVSASVQAPARACVRVGRGGGGKETAIT